MIKSQVIYSKLAAVSREMGETLRRTSRSPLIAEDRLFATGILTGDLRLAVQHQGDPSHLYALRQSVRSMFDYFAFDLGDGDVLIVGDTFVGGTQPQMLTIATPVFRDGEIHFFPTIRLPLMDVGGEYPGAFHPEATDAWQESLRITPLKLYRGGVLQTDILRFLCINSRAPTLLGSDLAAALAVCRTAGSQIGALLRRYGAVVAMSATREMFDYTERRVRKHLSQLPSVTEGQSTGKLSNECQQTVRVRITMEHGGAHLDFDGTSPQSVGPFNSTIDATKALATLPLIGLLLDELDINDGMLVPFSFGLPVGCVVSPLAPAATSLAPASTWHMIAEAVHRAVRSACDESIAGYRIDGMGPRAVLFAPIGTVEESIPICLDPGFPIAADGWGPPALQGQRRLVSAEEMEVRDHLYLISRQLMDGNGMRVRVVNHRGELEANFFVPSPAGRVNGAIRVRIDTALQEPTVATAFRLTEGAVIELDYPAIQEQP